MTDGVKGDYQKVTQEKFNKFIASYPNDLTRDVAGIFDPPLVSFNDFTDGKSWPGSVVAWYHDERNGPENWHISDLGANND
jgi:hypothetical protein